MDNDLIDTEESSSDDSDSDEEGGGGGGGGDGDDGDDSDQERDRLRSGLSNNKTEYVSGQTLLDLLDEQDRKREARESRRRTGGKKNSVSSGRRSTDINSITPSDHNNNNNNINNNSNGNSKRHDHKVFGFDVEFVAEVVSPPKQLCNTRFELTVDDMAFLGLPIHVNEDGEWRTHKPRRVRSRRSNSVSNSGSIKGESDKEEPQQLDDEDYEADSEAKPEGDEKSMNMFNLVFVMNPPVVEYNYRCDEMFHYVISRLSLVLRHEQAKSNYVWNESKKIMKIKEANEGLPLYELYSKLLSESSLASTISQCFNSISTSNIANLQINDKLISLQIPLQNQFKHLLPKSTPFLPGSYLSSMIIDENNEQQGDDNDNMGYMALLLLDEPEKVISDLKTELGSPLSIFIKAIDPMTSLSKLATVNNLDLLQLSSFAKHLIYWRRARAIIPLNARSAFIVSPMAPITQIPNDMKNFRQEFPALPSLPSFLSLLSSSKPRQYSAIIPSKDHRDSYMEALAWLIRHGYVTQLLTFVWLKIPNRIKIAVDEDLEREGLTKKTGNEKFKFADISTDNTSKDKSGANNDVKSNSNSSTNIRHHSIDGQDVVIAEEEEDDTILLDPERATAVERRWIGKVIKRQPPELVALFHKLVKYFNGNTPIELIMVKENISRHDVRRLLHGISDNVISVKHW